MGIKTHEKNINGHLFTVNEFGGMRGWLTFLKLSKGLLPALASALGSVKDWQTLDIDGENLSKAITILLSELDGDKSEILIKELFSMTWIDGKEVMPIFDTVFQANYGMLIKALAFVIEVNYKSFLGENGIASFKEKMPNITNATH